MQGDFLLISPLAGVLLFSGDGAGGRVRMDVSRGSFEVTLQDGADWHYGYKNGLAQMLRLVFEPDKFVIIDGSIFYRKFSAGG